MRIYENFELTNYNSYRLNAVCKRAYFPETDDDVIEVFESNTNKFILGAGNNVILSKDYYHDEFVIFSGNYNNISLVNDNLVLCEAGVNMKELTAFALKHSLSGVEIFYDIPSSIGGAVVMNAGAGGEDIASLLQKVWYYDPKKKCIEEITKEEIGFEYRNSFFQKNPEMIVTKVLLNLEMGQVESIKNKMFSIEAARHAKQPRNYPNAGSVFKRPPGYFVGPMIEGLGLKGFILDGAMVSEKHAGFIVNYQNATGESIIRLIHEIKKQVQSKYGVDLEIEQRLI